MQHESKQGSGAKQPLRKGFVIKLKSLGRQAQFLVDYVWVHLFPVDKLRGRRREKQGRKNGRKSKGGTARRAVREGLCRGVKLECGTRNAAPRHHGCVRRALCCGCQSSPTRHGQRCRAVAHAQPAPLAPCAVQTVCPCALCAPHLLAQPLAGYPGRFIAPSLAHPHL